MNSVQLEVAKGLFQLAWADGSVQEQEVHLIAGLLQRMGVSMAERLAMMDEALSLPFSALPDLDAVLPNRESRMAVMNQLVSVCFADGAAHPGEIEILGNLALRWGVTAEELEELRRKALQSRG